MRLTTSVAAVNSADMDMEKLWAVAEYAEAEDAGQIDSLRLETFQNLASSMRVSAQMLDPDVHL